MVASPDRAEMVDIFQARLALESFAIYNIAIPIAKETLAEISKYMEAYETAVNGNDFPAQHTSNRMFHHTILLLSGNKLIAEIVDNLKYRSHFWIGRTSRSDVTVLEHRSIFDTLIQGDLEELKRLNIDHLTKGYASFFSE